MKILLVGCGKMGSALYNAWQGQTDLDISILDPSVENAFQDPKEINVRLFDIIILAVKPQIIDEAIIGLENSQISALLYISILAGKTLKYLEKKLLDRAVIRAMPNLPSLVGQGMTVAISNRSVTEDQKYTASRLFEKLGSFEWIEDEKLMDAVTAVSGSGPAYVFLLIETLAQAAVLSGLPEGLAMKLARQTVIGSAALAAAQPGQSAAILRKNVTSPGGTTEAALEILMSEKGLSDLMAHAIEAAARKSRDLS